MDSFIKWVGGKSRLREEIISFIPAHKSYVEPFGGACWVLFGKPPSPVEYINDLDGHLINLYLVVRDRLEEFLECADRLPISEELFRSWSLGYTGEVHGGIPGILTNKKGAGVEEDAMGIPVAAAVRTYYLIMNAFNGKVGEKPSFAVGPGKEAAFVRFYSTDWEMVEERLKRVTILSRHFEEVFKATDSPDTFYYLDPPYLCATGNQRYYRCTFSEEDHQVLRVYLARIEGRFLLSYQDDPCIREWYGEYVIRPSSLVPGEVFIMNYTPPDPPFYGSCSTGIPRPESVYRKDPGRRAPFFIPNCPHCGSQRVQRLYRRVTYENKRRSFKPMAFVCNNCGGLFQTPTEEVSP